MLRNTVWFTLIFTIVMTSGCSSLGYFDNSEFIEAINSKPKQCQSAYLMLTKIFDVRTGEMTHRGIWELHCGSRQKGQEYLSRAAKAGDGYAKKIMVLNGLQLPDPEIPTYGGGAVIDVFIHK